MDVSIMTTETNAIAQFQCISDAKTPACVHTRYGLITSNGFMVKASIRNAQAIITLDGSGYAEVELQDIQGLSEEH
jgi:hypothetical protein